MIDLYPLVGPLLRRLDPETAHGATIAALKSGLVPKARGADDPILACRLWGLDFPNPVGLAAGFDKNAEVADAMLAQGFGFVEIGSVTPRPQVGNPRPRVFRLPEQRAMINRYGFNNDGLDAVAGRLEARLKGAGGKPGLVGANVGKNKETVDAAADYEIGIRRLTPLAGYLVINVSSPNTPGLRALQGREPLAELLGRALAARAEATPAGGPPPPLLLKIAPDLTTEDKRDVAEVALASGIDGLIVSNTTITRPAGLPPAIAAEAGGFSGAPLMAASTAMLAEMYRLTEGRLPLIGCGGISSGRDAYAKIRAGASLVQLYTALVYRGPALVGAIKRDLAAALRADGFASLQAAVGADHRLDPSVSPAA
ncbi:dihydroorotate dehydrogenase [Skermanella stibiiresistens SB22]|uniref:Dihydroorotate dehydrogenase (quinone) n=1 Tax=Skermanella stibiiresistens SB22 TaxID=1385369 RepID=W9GUC0_9PROT|nr:quinone-dependent dihydroorotate dehydrogenase [Skermanella stibiiresistens]EWY37500.1 dihydroorotate dehydrogenase [Skermanella stibiiresistens SB22]